MRQEFEDNRTESTVTVNNADSLVVEPEPEVAADSSQRVDRLLSLVRKRTRLQKVYRWLAAAISGPPIALFVIFLIQRYYQVPFLVGYEKWINPIFTSSTTVYSPGSPPIYLGENAYGKSWTTMQASTSTVNTVDFLTPCILALVCFCLIALAYRQRARLTRELAEYDDIWSVGALTDALGLHGAARSAASSALTRLLPRLFASDAGLLNDSQRDRLRQEILGRNEDLSSAILKSYKQVGDARDLAIVEKIASGKIRTSSRIKDTAENCLPYLRHRVDTAATLLRPAAEGRTNSPALLRPAATGTRNPPESLLRPSDG